ncbi:MAG: molybdate ABC transporter substrate-binding protein [Oscillochloris sp.]|nr:molybdate ABC transporter substrate-binding protein [Oscillochloris sp.]
MRRSPIALFALLLALLLSACGGAPTAQSPTSTSAPAAEITVVATEAATDSATEVATEAVTEVATVAATEAATEAVTTLPTDAPTAAAGTTLNVFAAASLTDAFTEIATAFEAAHPGVTVTYNFAGSQQLATQINEGAPVDVFASANRKQMDAVITSSKVVSGTESVFAGNRLVLITPKENPAGIVSLKDLAKPNLKLVLADKSVPVGQYALDFLAKASALPEYTEAYSATVLANVVSYEDNVRTVLTKVSLGEGDAGIVYTTDAALDADKLQQIIIPDELNSLAKYPIAALSDSASPELAQAFVDYVLSGEGQKVLETYGFIPVK